MNKTTNKKALIVTTVSGFVPQFELNNVQLLKKMDYEIHYASNYNTPVYTDNNDRLKGTGIVQHQVDFVRSPFLLLKNLKALGQLIQIMKIEKYDLVHCHTPMGSVIARIAAQYTKTMPIIYTAHGFHFFKGAPILNWLLFYPIEHFLAHNTDCLITMNQEDYDRAKKFTLRRSQEIHKINGIGVSLELNFQDQVDVKKDKQTFTLITVGELSKRKNQVVMLEALAKLKDTSVNLIVCGTGNKMDYLKKKARQLGVYKQVSFKGYCTNIREQLKQADCFVFPSLQEGLPVALMEAMAVGLPVICSNVRGNNDLIKDGEGGYLVSPKAVNGYVEAIKKLRGSKELRSKMGKVNYETVKQFDSTIVKEQMKRIYEKVLE